jgi:hypothetical protein
MATRGRDIICLSNSTLWWGARNLDPPLFITVISIYLHKKQELAKLQHINKRGRLYPVKGSGNGLLLLLKARYAIITEVGSNKFSDPPRNFIYTSIDIAFWQDLTLLVRTSNGTRQY